MMQAALFLTLQETLKLHGQLVQRFRGKPGVRDMGLLESALVRPQTGYYETLSMQAAALFQSLCQNQCFVDGNRRAAFASVAIFLRMNGYRLSVRPDYGEHFSLDQIIPNSIGLEDIATWLENRMEKVQETIESTTPY